jgi:hypothetical protein
MNIRSLANLTMASLLLIGSACSDMFARDEKTASNATRGGGVAITGVVANQLETAKE